MRAMVPTLFASTRNARIALARVSRGSINFSSEPAAVSIPWCGSPSSAYEHMQGSRFRHMAHFRRWRNAKKPSDGTCAQLEVVPPQELMAIFSSGR
jgi:hypothetical protein